MPTYEIQAPDGRTLSVEGPTPPTEADLDAIFKAVPAAEQPQNQQMGMSPVGMTAAGYAAGAVSNAGPLVNKAASYVAKSPIAQRAIGAGIGAVTGLASGVGDVAVDAIFGGTMKDVVAKGAEKLAKVTAASKATVGRAANGQFVKLKPALPSVLSKAGPMMGLISGESDALSRMNSPEAMQAFLSKLTPEARAKLEQRGAR